MRAGREMMQEQGVAWFIIRDGQQHGPVSVQEVQAMIARGLFKPTDMVWRDGFADWQPCHQAFRLAQPAPPPIPQPPPFKGGSAAQSLKEQSPTQVCSLCQTELPISATACRGCGAIKIYTNGHVHGFFNLFMQVPLGGILFFLAIWFGFVFKGGGEIFLLFAAGLAVYLFWTIKTLSSGPRWIKRA